MQEPADLGVNAGGGPGGIERLSDFIRLLAQGQRQTSCQHGGRLLEEAISSAWLGYSLS
jgi:hypothetical protein